MGSARTAMKTAEGLRSEALSAALEQAAAGHAVAGRTDALYNQLALLSGLPGPRMNLPIAQAFAVECGRLGAKVDALALRMASLSPEEARGASGREFLPVCGVLALAMRASKEPSLQAKAIALFHDLADDTRFRVREAIPLALARMGSTMGEELTAAVGSWMDGYFQATAVVLALGDPLWLEKCGHEAVIELLQSAFDLAHDAPSSAVRYPGHKALLEALRETPVAVTLRFKRPMIERLELWSTNVKVPALRKIIEGIAADKRIAGHFGAPILAGVHDALKDSKKPPRDPSRIIHGTRGRGGHRRR